MSIALKQNRSQIQDFDKIIDLGPDKLEALAKELDSSTGLSLQPDEILSKLSSLVDPESLKPLIRQLLSIQGAARKSNQRPEIILDGIIRTIVQASGPDSGQAMPDRWSPVRPAFVELLSSQIIRQTSTAIELAYDYANLLRNVRILTDIRPIFDVDAKEIEGAVISYTLRIEYESSDGIHEVSIAMDEKDINDLLKQSERAKEKTRTAEAFVQKMNLPTSVMGRGNDA